MNKKKPTTKALASEATLTEEDIKKVIKVQKEKAKLVKDTTQFHNFSEENNDLNTFIFDEDKIIKTKVFTSSKLNDETFGYGILLPRMEDTKDKKGNITGKEQVWRGTIITSNNRGFVVSKWLKDNYKIQVGELPAEMKRRWELRDIDNYLHSGDIIEIDPKILFEDMRKKYEHYCFYRSDEWYDVNVLWDLGTYFHQLFTHYPIKEERGLKGTAKSKTMDVSIQFSLNPTDKMINPSEATLFRLTEEIHPTKYIDEAERLFQRIRGELMPDSRVELINASYERNGKVPRQEKFGNKFKTVWYSVYSPTRIGSINGMYGATEDRCITQIHTKNPDKDKRGERDVESDDKDNSWKDIRNRIYRWSLGNWKEVETEYINFDIKTKLKKRDLQLWKPLLVLAKIIDEENLLPKIIKFSEEISKRKKQDNIPQGTLDWKYLDCINDLVTHKGYDGKLFLEKLKSIMEHIHIKLSPEIINSHQTC